MLLNLLKLLTGFSVQLFIGLTVFFLASYFIKAKNSKDSDIDRDAVETQKKLNHIWKWRYQNIPNKFFGHGCDYPFEHYISGESNVTINNLDELCTWLLGCKYIPDYIKKGQRDHWSHPDEFESERTGDCEDFALWAWRKLKDLHFDADFTVGKWIHENGRIGTHAWVIIRQIDGDLILETTGRSKERMLKPLLLHRHEYIPFAAVDTELRKKVYLGIIAWLGRIKRSLDD